MLLTDESIKLKDPFTFVESSRHHVGVMMITQDLFVDDDGVWVLKPNDFY